MRAWFSIKTLFLHRPGGFLCSFLSHLFITEQLLCSPPLKKGRICRLPVSKPEKAVEKNNKPRRVANFFGFELNALARLALLWVKGTHIFKKRFLCLIFRNMKELSVYLGRDLKPFVGFFEFFRWRQSIPLFWGKVLLLVVLIGTESPSQRASIILL